MGNFVNKKNNMLNKRFQIKYKEPKKRENLEQLFVRRLTLEDRMYLSCPSDDQTSALYTHLQDRSPRPSPSDLLR